MSTEIYTIDNVAALIPCTPKDIRKLVAKGTVEGEFNVDAGETVFSKGEVAKIAEKINECPYVPVDKNTGEFFRQCTKCGKEARGFFDVEAVFGFSKVKSQGHRRSRSVCRDCHAKYRNNPEEVVGVSLEDKIENEPTKVPAMAAMSAKVLEMPGAAPVAHRRPLPSIVEYAPEEALVVGPVALDVLTENTAEGSTMVPEVDPGFDLDDTEAIIIANALKNAEPTWIWGPSGVGKTSGVRQVAALTRWPVYRVQMSADFSLDDFVGTTEVVPTGDGSVVTRFRDGVLIRAMRNGGILLIDEITGTPPHVLLALQAVLERVEDVHGAWAEGKAHTKFVNTANGGEVVHAHSNFRIIVTDNTNGQGDLLGMFSGTNVMNEATRSRFTQWFHKGFPERARWEKILLAKIPGLHAKKAESIVEVAVTSNKQSRSLGAATGACDLVINPRDTLAIARLAMVYDSVNIAFTVGLANSIDPMDPDAQYLKDLVKNIVGSH